jgi:hypothetical protein
MAVVIARESLRGVRSTLGAIADDRRAPQDLRANSSHWSRAVGHKMERRDVQTAAWLLLSASGARGLPAATRRAARYWGTFLQAQV